MATTKHVLVVGAGPGGLACARVLQRAGVAVTVLDRDAGRDARTQGGSLDLHDDTGQRALAAAGLLDGFHALARPEGQEMRLYDSAARLVLHRAPEAGDTRRPEIDRGDLRRLLLDSLDPGTVRWNHAVDGVVRRDDGRWTTTGDDDVAPADLVVGADGAWSRVRPAVSAAGPAYTGVVYVETVLESTATELVGNGMMVAKGVTPRGNAAVFAQRNAGGRVKVGLMFRAPVDWAARVGARTPEQLRLALLEMLDGWDPGLCALVADGDGVIERPLHVLPVPHTWAHVPGVTLLGDAAHLMPPLGLGANLALLDGTDLATAVVTHDDLDDAVVAYEAAMVPRGAEAAAATGGGLDNLIPREGDPLAGTLAILAEQG